MAETVSALELHATFRFWNDRQNMAVTPTVGPTEIDKLLNYAQRAIQGDEIRPYRTPDGRGLEATKEHKRNLQTFINADPVLVDLTKLPLDKPGRWPLPENHRYTISAKISWRQLPNTFYPLNTFTHDEWLAAEQNAFQSPTYYDPALISHADQEELLPNDPSLRPHTMKLWFIRLPKEIKLDPVPSKSFGMELPSWMAERVVQEAVTRLKFIGENQGANFQAALSQLTK